MKTKQPAIIHLVSIVQELSIIRAGDLSKYGIHPEILTRAVHRGLVVKIGGGIYTRKDLVIDIERQILLAMKRAPRGVVSLCASSPLRGHRVFGRRAPPGLAGACRHRVDLCRLIDLRWSPGA